MSLLFILKSQKQQIARIDYQQFFLILQEMFLYELLIMNGKLILLIGTLKLVVVKLELKMHHKWFISF